MAKKTYGKLAKTCSVTFELPAEISAQTACVCGDLNEWSPTDHPMVRRKDGRFSVTINLPVNRTYRYRFLIDGSHWENDWDAEMYVHKRLWQRGLPDQRLTGAAAGQYPAAQVTAARFFWPAKLGWK